MIMEMKRLTIFLACSPEGTQNKKRGYSPKIFLLTEAERGDLETVADLHIQPHGLRVQPFSPITIIQCDEEFSGEKAMATCDVQVEGIGQVTQVPASQLARSMAATRSKRETR